MEALRRIIGELSWKVAVLIAAAVCTAGGWVLFGLARENRIDHVVGQWLRTIKVTLEVMFRMDPILMLIFFPVGILILLILFGLLIWLQHDR